MDRSVSQALAELQAASGIDTATYRSARLRVQLGFITLVFPNPGQLPLHDLHHAVLGVPMTFWGEVEVSTFELRTGVPTALIALLCVGSVVLGALCSPRRALAIWRRYAGCRHNLYGEGAHYEQLLGMTVGQLRHTLQLPP
jgi:hypothetical protein